MGSSPCFIMAMSWITATVSGHTKKMTTNAIFLVGYSLGSLVIFEALQHLASLPPSQTLGLIQDVYLFGSPISTSPAQWAAVRVEATSPSP